jgi:hypothetical protein
MPATASKKSGEMNRADKRSSITIMVLGDGAYRHYCGSSVVKGSQRIRLILYSTVLSLDVWNHHFVNPIAHFTVNFRQSTQHELRVMIEIAIIGDI